MNSLAERTMKVLQGQGLSFVGANVQFEATESDGIIEIRPTQMGSPIGYRWRGDHSKLQLTAYGAAIDIRPKPGKEKDFSFSVVHLHYDQRGK
jgi:hypothetical protein